MRMDAEGRGGCQVSFLLVNLVVSQELSMNLELTG